MKRKKAGDGKCYNRRQNELRHFALNWAFLSFTNHKRRKYSFSSPIPSIQCCADVRATHRKQQTPQLWMEGTGEGRGFFFSPKLPYLSTMSQQFCRWLSESQKWPCVLKKFNWTHFFMLGCETPSGFLFAMFDFTMPILEQSEQGDFVVFSAWHFVSRLTCLDIARCSASRTISYSLLYRNEPKQRTKWKGYKT